MAPYLALMRGMTREGKEVVVAFVVDTMNEQKPVREVSPEFKKLRGMVSITEEEMSCGERLAHIMKHYGFSDITHYSSAEFGAQIDSLTK